MKRPLMIHLEKTNLPRTLQTASTKSQTKYPLLFPLSDGIQQTPNPSNTKMKGVTLRKAMEKVNILTYANILCSIISYRTCYFFPILLVSYFCRTSLVNMFTLEVVFNQSGHHDSPLHTYISTFGISLILLQLSRDK